MSSLKEYVSNSMISLCTKHKWLIPKTENLFHLYSECSRLDEAELVTELLDRFTMIKEDERNEGYCLMADYISSVFIPNETLIVAMTKSGSPDSGQKVLTELRTFLVERGIRTDNYLNRFDNLSFKKHGKFKQIIVVDEFLGSGKTLSQRVREINGIFPLIKSVHFCLLAGMSHTIRLLEEDLPANVKVFCHYKLKRGIWGYNSGLDLIEKTTTMINLEGRLSQLIGTKKLRIILSVTEMLSRLLLSDSIISPILCSHYFGGQILT